MNKHLYIPPFCEEDTEYALHKSLLADSDFVGDGAGDFLEDGGEFIF